VSDLPFDIDEDDGAGEATLASSVLVVDDEWVVRDVFSRLLSRESDLSVEAVESAEAAIDRLQEKKFELLITDKNLPGMGGVELIAKGRALRPAMEAVMITGYATAESLLAALAAGATDYLTKPFDDLKVVRAKIRAALEQRTNKVQGRQRARALAREAQALLSKGGAAKDAAWDALDKAFGDYEAAIKGGGSGLVTVEGRPEAVDLLVAAGLNAQSAGPRGPLGLPAAVMVVDTSHPTWREDAETLVGYTDGDVLLLAGPDAGLPELLEALTLKMELVGFGQTNEAGLQQLPAKVRALMMTRAVNKAQAALSAALEQFKATLG
jgi:CheY-like chemotaxis protein